MQHKTLNDSCHAKLIYVLYDPVSDNDNKTTGHLARMYHNPPSLKLSCIHCGLWLAKYKAAHTGCYRSINWKVAHCSERAEQYGQTGRDGGLRSARTLIGRKEVTMKCRNVLFIGLQRGYLVEGCRAYATLSATRKKKKKKKEKRIDLCYFEFISSMVNTQEGEQKMGSIWVLWVSTHKVNSSTQQSRKTC